MIRIKNNRGGPSMAQGMSQFKQQRTMKGDDMCDNDYEEEKDYKP